MIPDPQKSSSFLEYEHRRQPLLPRKEYLRRLINNILFAIAALTAWIFLGMIGYHLLGGLSWVDSFLNAAMIAGGMGPVDQLKTSSAKVFAGLYAIFSGVLILTAFAVIAAPIYHRFMHRFHLETEEQEEQDQKNDV